MTGKLSFSTWRRFAKPSGWCGKRPFGGPEQVLNYLGRYTHRVAISNTRLLDIDHDRVSFHWKDYRHGDQQKTVTLEADEFIRRFLLHVLPDGFQRIRHYGFLQSPLLPSQAGSLPPTPGGGLNRHRPAAAPTRLS